ncbi:hypothetical protein NEISUBOT_03678 [Neisseria subflava NJ9703]|uniref:Uncharacterized protein n=1 Tax=Neisseria subflava NJ9703 TaxID=546268 RepID=A0A9W5IS86_NEISU|nr:hypothetical protein NEISUBOT_03678 [Neisseria subflava NJ9703]
MEIQSWKVGIWTDLAGTIAAGLSFKPEMAVCFQTACSGK